MSSFQVIRVCSTALRTLLYEELEAQSETADLISDKSQIVLANPTQTRSDQSNRLSLWLYHVTEDEHLKNQPMATPNGAGGQGPTVSRRHAPLALRFYFLITPFGRSGDEDHLLLGKIMQVAHDNAIVYLRDSSADVYEEMRIALFRNTLEEQTRIWDALNEPYRLSISYQVKVAQIESQRVPSNARVIDRVGHFPDAERAVVA